MSARVWAVGLLLGCSIYGCSSMVQSRAQSVAVTSVPAGATVLVDGHRQAGVTPMSVILDPSRTHTFGFTLGGCRYDRTVRPSLGLATYGTLKIPVSEMPEVVHAPLESLCEASVLRRGGISHASGVVSE